MTTLGEPQEVAIRMLREWPHGMNESDRYAKLCVAIACDFPEIPVDQVLTIATTAMTRWKRSR